MKKPQNKSILRLFWQATRQYRHKRNLAVLSTVSAVVINGILAPLLLSQFLNQLQANDVTLENSLGLIATYGAIVFVGEVVIWRLSLYFCWTFEVASMRGLLSQVFDNIMHRDHFFHANRFNGSLVSQANKLVGAFERFWDMITWSITPMVTMTIGAITTIALLGYWPYALAIAVISGLFIAIVIISSKFLQPLSRHEADAHNKNSGYLADMTANVMTVKSFSNESYELDRFKSSVELWHSWSSRLKWGVIGTTSVYSTLVTIIKITALLFAVIFASNGSLPVGMAYLLLVYTLDVSRQLWEMNSIVRNYSRVIGDASDMVQILETPFSIIDHSSDNLQSSKGAVNIAGLTFRHDNGDGEQVFTDFNLQIPGGQRVGIVGKSGSGKTTLARLLMRFSDIQSGIIAIDDQDISQVTQHSLRQNIAYVPQEPLLFHRSIQENVAYSKPAASKEEVRTAIRLANAEEFISKLPHGLDTVVGERGVKLSGGQRQRIAIARAILKDAPILILDEATSALDSESEKLIQDSLEDLMKNRTSIVIAHRLSTIAKLDRIVVLDKGKVVEDGTHQELLDLNGAYAKLWKHQSGGFIDE